MKRICRQQKIIHADGGKLLRHTANLFDILGEESFTESATVFYFATCLFSKSAQTNTEDSQLPKLTNDELLLLWQRQSEQISLLAISKEQWKIAGEFFFRLLFIADKHFRNLNEQLGERQEQQRTNHVEESMEHCDLGRGLAKPFYKRDFVEIRPHHAFLPY